MTTAIADRIKTLQPDHAQGENGLRLVPILGSSHEEPAYRLLEDEILDSVVVTEINESGSVPELRVTNALDERVLLIDGQELIGAKQNRILNTDVLVSAKKSLNLPVSCVEQGRWGYGTSLRPPTPPPPGASADELAAYIVDDEAYWERVEQERRQSKKRQRQFMAGKSASFSTRRRKSARVHAALKRENVHDADQGQVWDEVQEELQSAGVHSPTGSLNDLYAARERELIDFRSNLSLPDEAVGLAVFYGGSFQGLDLFDRHTTLKYFWDSLVDSYALSWLSQRPTKQDKSKNIFDEGDTIRGLLDQASESKWEDFDSPGEGRDYRLGTETLTGSSLIWEDKVLLHLQLFSIDPDDRDRTGSRQARRPRIHRRYGTRRRNDVD
jgi:ARG and Rhodanese-Phosphatase-superfamily-associated Protein domain